MISTALKLWPTELSLNYNRIMAHIFQINLSKGGVPKLPITSAKVTLQGLDGDRQKNTKLHGGTERALCLYPLEHILDLQAEGNPIFPGALGENITLKGVEWDTLSIGDQLQLGDEVLIELTSHTNPCKNIGSYFKDGSYERVAEKRNAGWSRFYARVLKTGQIQIGDRVTELKSQDLHT